MDKQEFMYMHNKDKEFKNVLRLNREAISTKWFRECIGGIEVEKSVKEETLDKINKVIDGVSKNDVTVRDFVITYPDSLYLVKKYFEIYSPNIHLDGNYLPREYREKGCSNQQQYQKVLLEEKRKIDESKIILLIIYGPILSRLKSEDEINKMLDILGIDLVSFGRVINLYNVVISKDVKAIRDLEEDYNDVIAGIVISSFLNNDVTKEEVCSKYGIGSILFSKYIDKYVSIHPELQKEIENKLRNNSRKKFFYINNLILMVANYIDNGIIIDSTRLPFTMLDYICLTSMNIDELVTYIKKLKDFDSKAQLLASRTLIKFYSGNRRLGKRITESETVLNQKNIFIINGNRVEPTKDDIEEIFNLFDENNIPKLDSLIYIALNRKARGNPILPLLNMEKENTNSYN